MTDWLQNLKVGDEVGVTRSCGLGPEISTVARISKAQIFIGNHSAAFWKKNGWSVGGSDWHRESLIRPTPEIKAEIIERHKRAKARELARNCDTTNLPMEKVEALIALLGDEGKA